MSTTDYFVLCETTTQDENGRISLINIFDSISTDTLPATPGKITIAFSFEIEPKLLDETLHLRIEMDGPDGKNLFAARGEVTATKSIDMPSDAAARIISSISINSPSFESHGEYKYRLKFNDSTLSENCLRILETKSIKQIKGGVK